MSEFAAEQLKIMFQESEIALMGEPERGSLVYLPYGAKIRRLLYGISMQELEKLGFEPILLSDFIGNEKLQIMDNIIPVLKNYLHTNVNNLSITAGHEINFYLFAKNRLRKSGQQDIFPLQYYHFGGVYRTPKHCKYPFNLGERKSFLECYSVHRTREETELALMTGIRWNRKIIRETLKLPSIEVERPLITNKRISRKTVCIDSITPMGITAITGMNYLHDDIFTRALGVKYKDPDTGRWMYAYSAHFGISDNIFFSYLTNTVFDGCFHMLSRFAPIQILIIYTLDEQQADRIKKDLKQDGFRAIVVQTNNSCVSSVLKKAELQGIPVIVLCRNDGNLVITFMGQERFMDKAVFLGQLRHMLEENDKMIWKYFQKTEQSHIIFCENFQSINETLKSGKVACIWCSKDDEKVRIIEEHLRCGEILGFYFSDDMGADICDGTLVNSIAYLSRRS